VGRLVHGWQMVTDTVGVYGNYYLKRAAFTILGMGALPVEESIYPLTSVDADGQPLAWLRPDLLAGLAVSGSGSSSDVGDAR
jgi:hypothetical protein